MTPKRWLATQQRRRAEIIESLERFTDELLVDFARRTEQDTSPGPSSATSPERRGVGTHSDPTAAKALADERTDLMGQWLNELDQSLKQAWYFASRADHIRVLIAGVDRLLDRSTPQPGAGDCLACSKWVTGGESDRIKSGYCPACWMAWCRQGRPDRMRFQAERRSESAA